MNYTPLWIKTDYSILSSLIKIDDLINTLKENNIDSCAICDDNLYGAMEFYQKCNLNDIKPIIGLEVNVGFTMLCYAKNYLGYQNLCNINSLISKEHITLEIIKKYLNNLVVILPFEYMGKKDELELLSIDLIIGYKNSVEKEQITGNSVYINKTLCLKKEDIKYLKYLYKIKDSNYEEKEDVSFKIESTVEDKKTTAYVASLCDLKIEKDNSLLPVYNDDPDFNEKEYLTKLAVAGLKKRLSDNVSSKYIDRLKYELNVITKMGFCNYFLVVWDYVKYARKNGIMTSCRGSAASSLVSYCLGITDIDPLKYDLLFERFLNPNRVTMPDIDIDFDAEKREEVIKYVEEKYGKDKVCGIITFSNLLSKQVIRDLGRTLEISNYKIDNLVKNFGEKLSLKENLSNISVKRILNDDDDLKKLYDIALHLEGLKRHTSIHAAGIVISSKNLSDYVPLALDSSGMYLCGYTMNYIEDIGLLKMDFLGLKNLSIIDKVIKDKNIKFNDIPLDDEDTFKLFRSGELDGVFQFETAGMRRFITELKPTNINDLIAAVALFRPGPMENIPHYIARKQKKEKITYINDNLESILKETYGIIIYQEQIMQIASSMALFTYAEADELRRAMSKKKEKVLLSFKDKFIKGSINNGYTKNEAENVYELILKFANYGFNKSHSVSYGIVGYKIAYLKVHYPLYFECEILNNAIGNFNKTKNGINECKKLGVDVIKPNINLSMEKYVIKDDKLIYPLSLIKGIGALTAREIIKIRDEKYFDSYLDYVKRTYKLGKDVLKNVILSGALDIFNMTRCMMIENIDEAINYAELCSDLEEDLVLKPELKEYEEYSKEELTKQELNLYGFYISNHPTNKYIYENSITVEKLDKYFDKNVNMVLYFERKKELETKKKDKMMFITASDSYGSVDLVLFPNEYKKYFNVVIPGIYKISAKVEKRFSKLQLVINKLERCDD